MLPLGRKIIGNRRGLPLQYRPQDMSKISYSSIPVLKDFPRVILGHTPTPLEFMPRLSQKYSGVNLYVKRDDCTGLGLGGNKVRQLEYYLGDALSKGCDTVLSTGAVQSNYMRTLAAAASKLGLECHIQLENRVSNSSIDYQSSGNRLLTGMFGATIHYFTKDGDENVADDEIRRIADKLESEGKKPYVVPLAPVRKPKGALGYIDAAYELMGQCQEQNLQPDLFVVGSGSGMTHSGLLYGLRLQGVKMPVIGACVRRNKEPQHSRIQFHCNNLSVMFGIENPINDNDIVTNDEAFGPGYGQVTEQVSRAISLAAHYEGLLVDPVYSGKVLACLIHLLESGNEHNYKNIVFIHTGGTPALFAYRSELEN